MTPFAAPAQDVRDVMEFLLLQREATDIVLAFDGLSRSNRRFIEDALLTQPRATELFVVYDKPPDFQFCRRNFFGAKHTEMGTIIIPTSRNRLAIKNRGKAGTTSSTCYTGTQMQSRSDLPRISLEEKKKVHEVEDDIPEKWVRAFGGRRVPLFWMETKSQQFWQQLLDDLTVKAVVDLSPGSGVLAEACMSSGVQYFGIVRNQTHLGWLNNSLDKTSLSYIVESNSWLYDESLAQNVKDSFDDILNEGGDAEAQLSDVGEHDAEEADA